MKKDKREKARKLRQNGMSLRDIAERLSVSLSTVSVWTRDVKLTKQQRKKLDARNPVVNVKARKKATAKQKETWRTRRAQYQEQGKIKAQENDPNHKAGCMLFWAEGSKKKNSVVFCNSDIDMMKFFLNFLRIYYGVKNEECSLRFNCHLNNGLTLEQVQQKWLTELRLPKECLRSSTVKTEETKKGKLPYGICTLNVNQTSIVQQIFGAIQEYASFSRPDWLF